MHPLLYPSNRQRRSVLMTHSITVLVINSNSEDRETYKQLLGSEDRNSYHFIETDTGTNALRIVNDNRIDCILIDQNLPDMEGIELLNVVNQERDMQLPFIFLAGNEDEKVAEEAIKSGASGCLTKEALSAALLSKAIKQAIASGIPNKKKRNETNEQLMILDAIPSPIFRLDTQGGFVEWNRAFSDFSGNPCGNMVGKSLYDLFPSELADNLWKLHQQLDASSEAIQYQTALMNGDGQPAEVLFNIACFRDCAGKNLGSVTTILDTSKNKSVKLPKKKNVQEQSTVIRQNNLLQNAAFDESRVKVLLQLVGATAHELNQPLMTLLGNIELMSMSCNDPQQITERISIIEESGHRIAQIVKKFQEIRQDRTIATPIENSIVKIDQPLNILIVEDNDQDFEKLGKLLKTCGPITITRATDVAEGYRLLPEKKLDLIFLDYMLSNSNGLEFLSGMAERNIEVPVVVITGQGDEMVASKVIQAGAYDYLPKSQLAIKPLSRIIQNTLEKHRLKREVAIAIKKMAELSTRDELTDLFNRRYFKDSLSLEIARADRYGSTFTVIMIDLDHFKKINDSMGHAAGDIVLKQTSDLLLDCLRESDIACRYGGEEFAVLLPNTTNNDCWQICERFRTALAEHLFQWDNHQFHVTASIGLTVFRAAEGDTAEKLMQRADEALYKAKKQGRNRVAAL